MYPSHNPITSETSVWTGDEVVDTRPISIASRIDMSKINFVQRVIELVMTL